MGSSSKAGDYSRPVEVDTDSAVADMGSAEDVDKLAVRSCRNPSCYSFVDYKSLK